jgi:drug/metabolite transporter (DMT)-like permease
MQVYLYSALMAVIATVIPSYLVSEAIKRIGANNTAIISSIGPISTIFQAFIFLGEPVSFLQLVGTSFILTGVLLISVKGKIKTEPL